MRSAKLTLATYTILGATASLVHAHADPGLLGNLLGELGLTPQSQALRTDLQKGFGQFQPLLSANVFAVVSGTLSTLLSTLPGGNVIASPIISALAAAQLVSDDISSEYLQFREINTELAIDPTNRQASSQADAAVLTAAQECLNDIVSKKGIPSGYVCVDSAKNTINTYRTAFNTYLEQFVGIVPPNVVTAIQNQEKTIFGNLGLIPPANDLSEHINNAIASVVASTSGETVTAIERFEDCFAQATKDKNLQTRRCLTGPQSGVTSLFTLLAGVTQQFVGYLPPNVVNDLINNKSKVCKDHPVTASLS